VTERHRAVNYALISCDLSIMLSTVRYISSVGLQKPIHLLTGRRQSLSMPYWAQRSALSPRTKQIPVCYYSARPTHSSDTHVFLMPRRRKQNWANQGLRSIWDREDTSPQYLDWRDIITNVPLNISRVISATFYPCNIFLIS